jgi:putative acetyltransferase
MAEDYRLRRATNADLPAVWTLISAILRSYGITANKQTTDPDLTDLEANYWSRKGAFFVLLHGAEIIGTAALRRETDACCELCRMYLAQPYRGQGLGRRMLEVCLREARDRGFAEVHLKTASVLVEAIALYKRAGFTVVEGAPTDGNCDQVMRRSLRA